MCNRINKLHERYLRVIYNGKNSAFQKLLDKGKSASINNRILQVHATETYKLKGLSLKVFANTFTSRNQLNYKLHHIICLDMPLVNSVYNGTESTTFLGPKVWELVPEVMKQIETNCPCKSCKDFLHGVGFLQ